MIVEILQPTGIRGETKFKGERVDLSDAEASGLIRRGRAAATDTAEKETAATPEPPAETPKPAPAPEVEESRTRRKLFKRKGKR